jgi:hypothetical protein
VTVSLETAPGPSSGISGMLRASRSPAAGPAPAARAPDDADWESGSRFGAQLEQCMDSGSTPAKASRREAGQAEEDERPEPSAGPETRPDTPEEAAPEEVTVPAWLSVAVPPLVVPPAGERAFGLDLPSPQPEDEPIGADSGTGGQDDSAGGSPTLIPGAAFSALLPEAVPELRLVPAAVPGPGAQAAQPAAPVKLAEVDLAGNSAAEELLSPAASGNGATETVQRGAKPQIAFALRLEQASSAGWPGERTMGLPGGLPSPLQPGGGWKNSRALAGAAGEEDAGVTEPEAAAAPVLPEGEVAAAAPASVTRAARVEQRASRGADPEGGEPSRTPVRQPDGTSTPSGSAAEAPAQVPSDERQALRSRQREEAPAAAQPVRGHAVIPSTSGAAQPAVPFSPHAPAGSGRGSETAATAGVAGVPDPEPPRETAAAPLRTLSLELPAGDAAGGRKAEVQVRFVERGGEVYVAVRSEDRELASTLRGGLGHLADRMETQGYRAEIWRAPEPARADQQETGSRDARDTSGGGGNSGGGGRRQGRDRPAWLAALEEQEGERA